MQYAPRCAEFNDLHATLTQVINATEVALAKTQQVYTSSIQARPSKAVPPLVDLSALGPEKVDEHIAAIQQRAAMAGTGPPAWAIGARAKARLPPKDTWTDVSITDVTAAGKALVQILGTVPDSSFQQPSAEVALKDLMLLSPLAGAFWAPQQPPAYDAELPMWPDSFSDDEKEAQRDAATAQVAALHDAIKAGKSGFTFPAGVYRLGDVIVIERTHNFTLSMANVELITPGIGGHFKLLNNTNLVIRGPMVLDADPVGAPQTIIHSSDRKKSMEVLVMPGYPAPNKGRVMVFNNQGDRLPAGQITPDNVTSLGGGRFRLDFNSGNFALAGLHTVGQAGNYMLQEGSAGGVALWSNQGVTFEQVNVYGGGAVWGLWETGLDKFVLWRSLRRPGTNRLYSGGGAFQIEYLGGSFEMDRSEVSYSHDDLSDLFSVVGWTTANGQTSDTIWACLFPHWQPGWELLLYDAVSLELRGTAKIVSIDTPGNETAMDVLNVARNAFGMKNETVDILRLIRLDKAIPVSSLGIIDSAQAQPRSISVTNSYFHDGLNSGINTKGGRDVVMANNWVERTNYLGISSAEDRWWSEGGMAGNVVIRGNTVRSACYQSGTDAETAFDDCHDIRVYATAANGTNPTGHPIRSVTSVGNLVINSAKDGPIKITETQNVLATGNLPLTL
ncbi:g4252 [Coccomyxa viridis]|uniref:G4252 protein n=1 Tax=Coccomyxa viridis TaxID=1274662 RepID=A0ABP1FTV6_9CHLO